MTPAPQRKQPLSLHSLQDPVFGDERERQTWMESYVVAYEVALLAAVTVAAAMVWIGGRPLAWWSLAVIWIIGLGNLASLAHLRAAGLTDLPWRDRMRFWSFRARLVLILAWVVGLVRALSADPGASGLENLSWVHIAGMVVGLTVGIVALAAADRRTRRQVQAETADDDSFDA